MKEPDMPDMDRLAVAAHLHVLMRRRLNRITDMEWMSTNREYAMAMVRLAHASEHADLHEWAEKLERAWRVVAEAGPRLPAVPPAPPAEPRRYVSTLR
jgi:uncharacterized protein YyaL (SSP411 family)